MFYAGKAVKGGGMMQVSPDFCLLITTVLTFLRLP